MEYIKGYEIIVLSLIVLSIISAFVVIKVSYRKGNKKTSFLNFNSTKGDNSPILGDNSKLKNDDK